MVEAILDRAFDTAHGPVSGRVVAKERIRTYAIQACATTLFVLERSVRLFRYPEDIHGLMDDVREVVMKWVEAFVLLRYNRQAVLLIRKAVATRVFTTYSGLGAMRLSQLALIPASLFLAGLARTTQGSARRHSSLLVCEALDLHAAVVEEVKVHQL